MSKQTAVDFLFFSIYGESEYFDAYTTDGTPAFDAYKKAKEMEREQIIKAFCEGYDHDGDNYDGAERKYYKQNYQSIEP